MLLLSRIAQSFLFIFFWNVSTMVNVKVCVCVLLFHEKDTELWMKLGTQFITWIDRYFLSRLYDPVAAIPEFHDGEAAGIRC